MESSSYEGMSGTNTINTAAVLLETGMVEMVEPVTRMVLEAPAGLVRVVGRVRGRRASSGSRSRTCRRSAPRWTRSSRCRASGRCAVDVAYGGAWCAFVDAAALGFSIVPDEARELGELGERIRPHVDRAARRSRTRSRPRSRYLSFVVFVAPPRVGGDARHATIVSPGRLDRAPTGTATSARIAVLDARGDAGRDVRRRERDRHAVHRPRRRARAGRRPRRGRARDHRPRLDHGLPPARRRPRPTRSPTASSSRTRGARAAREGTLNPGGTSRSPPTR